MLGRDHFLISLAISLIAFFPLFFTQNFFIVFCGLVFLAGSIVGSLLPDADSQGGSKLSKDLPQIALIMSFIVPIVTLAFDYLGYRKQLAHQVTLKHRGIMHSPIGILIVSTALSIIPLAIFLILIKFHLPVSSLYLILALFSGLFFGQFLHLIEDTCTVSGLNWKFPFGTRNLNGKIVTIREEYSYLMEPRPSILIGIYFLIAFGIFMWFYTAHLPNFLVLAISPCLIILEILSMLAFGGVKF